jgi:stage V sporulation protein SpoVS
MNVVWKPSNLSIDTNGIGWQYTRSGPVANADYKTYDIGRLFLATEGISYTGTVGYIEVDYDVEFKRRQPDYTSSVVPTTDVYTPGAFIKATSIPASSQSSTFDSGSFSNNSIITIDKSTGTFTVTKAVKAIVITSCFDAVASTSSSTVGTIFNGTTSVSGSVNGGVIFLDPSKTYNLYNGGSNPVTFFVSLVILDNF